MGQSFVEEKIGYPEYKALLELLVERIHQTLGGRVVSVVLYGSVARGTARPGSDVDLLLVLRDVPAGYWRRLQPLLPILRSLRDEPCWKMLEGKGLTPFLSLLVLSLEEANENRFLYLDMIEEAIILVDQGGFFSKKLESLRRRLKELGAKKIRRNRDWYWDLKPDLKLGDSVLL
jgi:predicted nucleotidyltransferase